jgi:hypothetical protein
VPVAYPKADTFKVRGNTVDAFFADPNSGCIFTSAFVFASEETAHIPGNPKAFAGSMFLNLSRFNACTGELLLDAFASQPLTASSFQVSSSLGTATLNINTTAFDNVSGTSFDVAVALAWTATEGVTSGHSTSRSRFPGIATHFRFSGTTRSAQATGTITALGINLASSPSVFADISKTSSGIVIITH